MNLSEPNEKAGRIHSAMRLLPAAALALLTAQAVAQSQSIILNTSPTPTEIELLDGADVNLDPVSGDLSATPLDPAACSATTDCSDVQVSVTNFTVSPSTVTQGQSVVFNWNGRGAWACEGSGLAGTTWNGAKLPSGSQSVSTAALAPNTTYNVTLDCSNGPVSDTANVSLTVNESGGGGGGVPQFCIDDGRVPPAGLTKDTQIIVGSSQTTETWNQLFGTSFPSVSERDMSILNGRYASIEFDVPATAGVSGRISFDVLQTFITSGSKIVSLSQCPGDFTTFDSNCRRTFSQSAMRWAIGGGSSFDCELTPNTTYYLNVVYTDDDQPPFDDWACTGASNPTSASECGDILASSVN